MDVQALLQAGQAGQKSDKGSKQDPSGSDNPFALLLAAVTGTTPTATGVATTVAGAVAATATQQPSTPANGAAVGTTTPQADTLVPQTTGQQGGASTTPISNALLKGKAPAATTTGTPTTPGNPAPATTAPNGQPTPTGTQPTPTQAPAPGATSQPSTNGSNPADPKTLATTATNGAATAALAAGQQAKAGTGSTETGDVSHTKKTVKAAVLSVQPDTTKGPSTAAANTAAAQAGAALASNNQQPGITTTKPAPKTAGSELLTGVSGSPTAATIETSLAVTPVSHGTLTGTYDSTLSNNPAARTGSGHPPVAEQVAIQFSKAVAEGADKISIRLQPESLGRIDVQIELGKDGRMTALFTADRPETLEMLQRDARVLERALNDAGLKTESGGLDFNLRGGDKDAQSFARDLEQAASGGHEHGGEPDEIPGARPNLNVDALLDIHV